ncbi:ATP-binding protein [Actinocrispum sp. NPDC049592]|uniref:ATP-binding protein n=1 Tax=Actinocrispum sp. NPDC049592 TaxID=3154835 RepID=UPI003415B41E
MDPQTTQVDDLRLVALPTAMNCADMFVRFALREWHLVALQDEASHVASELVANVVERNTEQVPGFLTLRLRLHGDCLVIEVEDGEVLPPFLPKSLEGRKGGAMANPAGGNYMWCEVALPTGMNASAVPLPRRERRKPPASASSHADEPADVDDEFFERLLSKLNRSPEDPPPGGLR